MFKLVFATVCLSLALAQTPRQLPAGGYYSPYALGGSPYYPGVGYNPYAPQPNVLLGPKTVPVPKPVEPLPPKAPLPPQVPKPIFDIISQNNIPYQPNAQIPILRQNYDQQPGAGYQWDYATANGITAYENAQIIPLGEEQATKQVEGGYRYISLEGIPVEVTYTAGEQGFVPIVKVHIGGVPEPQK